jgi:hypothetical protein
MVTRIHNVNPLQLGIVYAVLYAILGLIFGLIFGILSSVTGGAMAASGMGSFGWLSIIIFPVFYAVAGFIGGLILGFLYNLVAGWTGGIEMTLSTPVVAAAVVVP